MSDGLVYSTEHGSMCPDCGKPVVQCICKKGKKKFVASSTSNDGVVRVSREVKGRKGKGVTVVTGIPLEGLALKFLAKEIKEKCGTGGTVKGDTIEIQGDNRDTVVSFLSEKGYTIKRVGG